MKTLIAILSAIIVAVSIYAKWEVNKYKSISQLQAVELSTLKDSVKVIQSKNGELSYQVQAVEVDKRNLKEALEIAGFNIKTLKEREIKYKQINNVLRAQLEASGSGQTTLNDTIVITHTETKTDTIFQSNFKWNNQFLFLNGNIQGKQMTFDYKYRTGIELIQFTKRKETIVSAYLTDPNASVISANSITISHKKRFWEKTWLWGALGIGAGIMISK